MASDPLAGIAVSRLDPDFLAKLRGLLGAAAAHGLRLKATEGWRDPRRSQQLYDAWVASGRKGPRAAPAGRSAHNYGLAVDFVALDAAGDVIQSSDAPEYRDLEELAQRYGLKTLRALQDGGHVELDGWESVARK